MKTPTKRDIKGKKANRHFSLEKLAHLILYGAHGIVTTRACTRRLKRQSWREE